MVTGEDGREGWKRRIADEECRGGYQRRMVEENEEDEKEKNAKEKILLFGKVVEEDTVGMEDAEEERQNWGKMAEKEQKQKQGKNRALT